MPTAIEPSMIPAQADGSPAASQLSLVAVKYGSSRSPVIAVIRSSYPASRSRAHSAAVRRSCQTIARRGAASVARSQITAVSRWLVSPTQLTGGAPAAVRSACPQAARVACQMPSGKCSTQPGSGKYCRNS